MKPATRCPASLFKVCLLVLALCMVSTGVIWSTSVRAQPAAGVNTGKRVALLIANQAYPGGMKDGKRIGDKNDWAHLANPVNDAKALGTRLTELGFEVQVLENLTHTQMVQAINHLAQRGVGAQAVLLYFAGHGAGIDGVNYLMPVNTKPVDEAFINVTNDGIKLETLLKPLMAIKGGTKIILLDACRNLPAFNRTNSVAGGLANISLPPDDTVISFATQAGEIASDGSQGNSPYVRGLLKGLSGSQLNLHRVMAEASKETRRLTGFKQRPALYADPATTQDFWFPSAVAVPGQEIEVFPGGPKLVTLPMGSYLRGTEDEEGRDADEGPVREVTLNHSIQMGITEVTRGQFAQFVEASGYITEAESSQQGCAEWVDNEWQYDPGRNFKNPGFTQTDHHPVVCVSWNDTQKYIEWLNQKAGLDKEAPNRFRLPSEAEWEFAARGVTSTEKNRTGAQHWRFYWGEDADNNQMCSFANGADLTAKKQFGDWDTNNCKDGFVYTAPVGSFGKTAKTRHPFGLQDVIGNVVEWTQDCYANSYAHAPSNGKAYEAEECRRVLRGGSFSGFPRGPRVAYRNHFLPSSNSNDSGFRLARTF